MVLSKLVINFLLLLLRPQMKLLHTMYVHLCTYDVHKNDSWKRWLTGGPDVVVVAAVSLATYIIAIVYYYILHAVGRAQLYGGTAAWQQP